MDIINHNNFTLPDYFPVWLSGNMEISGRFNIGQNFDFYLISAIRDYFSGKVKIQTIVSKNNFSEKISFLGYLFPIWVSITEN